MLKLSLKIAFSLVFCLAAALLLSACLEPQDVGKFLESDEVQDKIDRTRVGLTDLSGDGLIAGNERITGLKIDRYYRVEIHEEDENDETIIISSYKFVSDEGKLVDYLKDANRVSGTAIINLHNNLDYIVDAAIPLTGSMKTYHVESQAMIANPGDDDVDELYADSYGISIKKPEDTHYYYLELPDYIQESIDEGNTFQILLVPLNTPGDPRIISTVSGYDNIIPLRREGTITDYVFAEYNDEDIIIGFYVLKVIISGETPEDDDGIRVIITFNIVDGELEFTPSITELSQAELIQNPIVVSITIGSNPDIVQGSVVWKYNGEVIPLADELTLVIDFSDTSTIDFLFTGLHVFSIQFYLTVNGVSIPYSASYTVKINP